jgi:SAM-dependent methyltransferase
MPEPAYLSQTRAAYNAVALDYARLLHDALSENLWDRALLSAFAELVAADGGGPVADLGCGSGRLTGHLRSLGLVPLGIDLSSAMVEAAQQAHPDLPFLEGSITAVPLGDGVLAGALAWYSIIHIPSAELAPVFAEFHRVLRPAGHLRPRGVAGELPALTCANRRTAPAGRPYGAGSVDPDPREVGNRRTGISGGRQAPLTAPVR